MERICNLETVKWQEILIKVCLMFYNIEICCRGCGEKTVFLQSFNIPKCIFVGVSLVEGLFSLLFYCESGINQYAVQKMLLGRVSYYLSSVALDALYCYTN